MCSTWIELNILILLSCRVNLLHLVCQASIRSYVYYYSHFPILYITNYLMQNVPMDVSVKISSS